MVVITKEFLQYDKNNINYYINYPKIYLERDRDPSKQNMIDIINKNIYQDIKIFMDIIDEDTNKFGLTINYLTEFSVEFNFHNVISIVIEFSTLENIVDTSNIKSYNYDLDLKREIVLQDIFKDGTDYEILLKCHMLEQLKNITKELLLNSKENLEDIYSNICIDTQSVFYFTEDYLVLPFSSFELDCEIVNLIEFKIPFNIIYPYLSKYAIKKLVHKVIL